MLRNQFVKSNDESIENFCGEMESVSIRKPDESQRDEENLWVERDEEKKRKESANINRIYRPKSVIALGRKSGACQATYAVERNRNINVPMKLMIPVVIQPPMGTPTRLYM